MAASTKPYLTAALAAVLLLIMAAAILPAANASSLTVYQNAGCAGTTQQYVFCDTCYLIGFQGGYRFKYLFNQAGFLYESADCTGNPTAILTQSTDHCITFTQKSLMIPCSNMQVANRIQQVTTAAAN